MLASLDGSAKEKFIYEFGQYKSDEDNGLNDGGVISSRNDLKQKKCCKPGLSNTPITNSKLDRSGTSVMVACICRYVTTTLGGDMHLVRKLKEISPDDKAPM